MENKIISRITTKNYRNLINDEGIELNSLNILIGSNGSGKSNLVALLEFFKNCLTPTSDLESRGVTAFQDALSRLGNNILDASIKKPAVVKIEFEFPFSDTSVIDYELFLYVDKDIFINEEKLIHKYPSDIAISGLAKLCRSESYFMSHGSQIGHAIVKIDENNTFEELEVPTNELSLITIPKILIEKSNISPKRVPLHKAHRDLKNMVTKWQFYNANQMDLTKIRAASPKVGLNDMILSKSCENLPTVLDNIINHLEYGLDFEERINNAMKEILPSTRRLKTSRDSGGMTLTIQWYFDGMETPFYLDDMSDGTVRMLCWAIILHSPILPTLLVIDEPELSLHIAWMGILANWIKQASQKTQIIISTHSPDLLDYFTDCANDVICFEKTLPKGHFQAKKLPEEILKEKIAEGWQLGDLYRIGDDIIGGWPW